MRTASDIVVFEFQFHHLIRFRDEIQSTNVWCSSRRSVRVNTFIRLYKNAFCSRNRQEKCCKILNQTHFHFRAATGWLGLETVPEVPICLRFHWLLFLQPASESEAIQNFRSQDLEKFSKLTSIGEDDERMNIYENKTRKSFKGLWDILAIDARIHWCTLLAPTVSLTWWY